MQILSAKTRACIYFLTRKIQKKVIGPTLSRKLLGLIVHGLYLLPVNVFSIECIRDFVSHFCATCDQKSLMRVTLQCYSGPSDMTAS